MVGGKQTHGNSQVIRRLRMSRALGIQYSRGMRPASRTHGRERRKGSWWDRENNCIAIEGQDFAQDTQEGGADQFEFLPDSDEEGAHKNPCLNGSDDEFVPETEPQDIVHMSSIGRPCNKQGRPRFGTMFQEWRRILQQEEQQCAREIATKEQNESTTWSKEVNDKKGSAKKDKDHEDNIKLELHLHQKASFSDMETDDEASWVEDGVDLRGNSQLEEDSSVEDGVDLRGHSQGEEDSWVEDGVDLRGHSQVEEDSWVHNADESHGCSHVEGDDFKDKVNELIIAIFPAYKDVLQNAKP